MTLSGNRSESGAVKPLSKARIAIVHEWPVVYAGSERVVAAMLEVFPDAHLYALVHDPEALRGTPLEGIPVRTSFIQSLPKAKEKYRSYLPLMPLAVEQFDLRRYDIVLSSNHAVAKGALTGPNQLHASYVHTPVRYAWDLYWDYLIESGLDRGFKALLAKLVLHYVRLWDLSASYRVDAYLANSSYIARRIAKFYRRQARVLHPPVDVERYSADLPRDEFYVAVSRFVPYKRMEVIAEAFTRMGKPIVIIGEGSELEKVRRSSGQNVKLLGYQPDRVVADYLQRARAFVFAAREDFGIVPVEAQAAGCPVIAYGEGGTLETVVGWPETNPTGVFFDSQTPEAIEAAVSLFETHKGEFSPANCRLSAQRFSGERFCQELESVMEDLWARFQGNQPLE